MSNPNQNFEDFVAKLPRTGHNIGRDFKFTSSTGMILPVWQHVLNPSERINFRASMQTVSNELTRPAFLDIRQKIDLFFVPFTLLYTGFGQDFFQTKDFITSGINYENSDISGAFLPTNFFTQLDSNLPSSPWDFNRIPRSNPNGSSVYAFSYDTTFFDSKWHGTYRLLMHLGYNPNLVFRRMYDTLPDVFKSQSAWASLQQINVIPWMAAAYQCIYQNYYRDDDREKRNLLSYQLDYTLGGGFSNTVAELQYHQRPRDYFTNLHVSPIYSTLNLQASNMNMRLDAVNNYLDNSLPYLSNTANEEGGDDQYMTEYSISTYHSDAGLNSLSTGMIRSLFAVEKLNRVTGRARKNYDSQVMAHFGFKVPRDIKHEISFLGSIEGNIGTSTVISNSAAAPDPNQGFAGTELGERAGLAYGKLQGDSIDFTAPCHGIVMAVYYSIPNQSYPLIGKMDRMNLLNDRLDFYQPEFDRLGMQPVMGWEVVNGGYYGTEESFKPSIMIGWKYRYSQFKQKPNVHSVAFYRPYSNTFDDVESTDYGLNSWSPWVLGRNPFDIIEHDATVFADRTFQQPAFTSFMSSPADLDDVFVQRYATGLPWSPVDPSSGTTEELNDDKVRLIYHPWLLFQTDPFMHDLKVDCKLVSPMSVTGEPELE